MGNFFEIKKTAHVGGINKVRCIMLSGSGILFGTYVNSQGSKTPNLLNYIGLVSAFGGYRYRYPASP